MIALELARITFGVLFTVLGIMGLAPNVKIMVTSEEWNFRATFKFAFSLGVGLALLFIGRI